MDLRVEERTIAIVNRLFNPNGIYVDRDTLLRSELKMDSLSLLEFVMELESEFDMDINVEETSGFSRVGSFIEHIEFRKQATV